MYSQVAMSSLLTLHALLPSMRSPSSPRSTEINQRSSAELLKKFDVTAVRRYSAARKDHTSASIARYAGIFARLGRGNDAYSAITDAVRGMSMNNMVLATNDWRGMGVGTDDIWATYSLEANMAVTGALQEMIVQSDRECVSLLPALPDEIKSGSATGLLTRTGVTVVSLTWNKKKGTANAKLKAKKAATISVQLPSGAGYKNGKNGESYNPETQVISNVSIGAGKTVSIDFRI